MRSATRILCSLQVAFEGYQGLVGSDCQRPCTSSRTIRGRVGTTITRVSNDRVCPVKEGARAHRGDAQPIGRRFDMMKSAFERTPLLTRNRSHNQKKSITQRALRSHEGKLREREWYSYLGDPRPKRRPVLLFCPETPKTERPRTRFIGRLR